MAGDLLSIGVSGLRASQTVLNTIGNNISNANTEGYSRQRVDLSTRQPQFFGNGYVGKGVVVENIMRTVDSFLDNQLRVNTTNESMASVTFEFASQVNNLFANVDTGLAPVLEDFFNAVQEVADDPASVTSRQVMLSEAQNLVSRFHTIDDRLDEVNRAVNNQLEATVTDINSLATAISEVNLNISLSPGVRSGVLPNDLLDQRDQLLLELSELIGIDALEQEDGTVNVLIGTGQPLVIGPSTQQLSTTPNPYDVSTLEVAYTIGTNSVIVSDNLSSGELGGLLEFRNNLLNEARNGLGRLATSLAVSMNDQHNEGMDLNGALGGDLFDLGAPRLASAAGNTGTLTVAFDTNNIGDLTTADYQVRYDGANFILTNLSDNTSQTLGAAGAGPFSVDGLTITEGVAPAAGDLYLLQPTRQTARDIDLLISDATEIAAASPVVATAATANLSEAIISSGEVLDVTDANLQTTVNLIFDSATTYQVNGAGPSIAYTSGANIDINGWRVQITGSAQTGDTFTIQSNSAGVGDNRNMLALASLQSTGVLDSGNTTYDSAYGQMVSAIGSQTRTAEISLTALSTLREQAFAAREEVSGVNLDEEAANLLRWQQHYQASAQAVAIANTLFDALLNAVGS